MKTNEKIKKTIPVFFAADKNYLPYLSVAITSLKAHSNPEFLYKIHVLYTGELGERANEISALAVENVSISFDDISNVIDRINAFIHCRDYYTDAIYYRLFIPELFTQYEKAVYLDCDTVLLDDIANLYQIDLKDNLIGAVADQAVAGVGAFRDYTRNALGIPPEEYFNSGVIVMNLNKFREIRFYERFCRVLGSYHFIVAPDQDCLNLICKGKVYYYGGEWNRMPIAGKDKKKPALIHYNLTMKPWHYDDVLYQEYFWEYAKQTAFYDAILQDLKEYTPEKKEWDKVGGERLIALALAEADSPNNYFRTVANDTRKNENEVDVYGFIEGFSAAFGDFEKDRRIREGRKI